MHTTITLRFDHEDPDVLDSISALLGNTLPFMVDNVEISAETED